MNLSSSEVNLNNRIKRVGECADTAQHTTDAGNQFAWAERFHDVIFGKFFDAVNIPKEYDSASIIERLCLHDTIEVFDCLCELGHEVLNHGPGRQ